MNSETQNEIIDFATMWNKIWSNKWHILQVVIITFVVSCIIILPVPRTYNSNTQVSPEASSSTIGSLGSLASSFGINLGGMQTNDALFPELYPDIISTNEFIVGLFDVPVRSLDGEIDTNYYTYMRKYQRTPYYAYPFKWLAMLKNLFANKQNEIGNGTINPNHLDKETDLLVKSIRENIGCKVDKKTGVITIAVNAQDPLICATMTDTISKRLQNVITEYRTKKARIDADYYYTLMVEAEQEFTKADQIYSNFCDANWNVQSQAVNSQKERLENDRDIKKNTYNAVISQYQVAMAKVQERTPVYTVLSAPCVPVKASKPKRMIFVLFMCFMAGIVSCSIICKKEIKIFLSAI